MSSGIDIEFVREHYQRMTDEELIRITTQDAVGLTPEALEVAKAEIKKRGLNENMISGLEAQNRDYTLEEIDAYCDIISRLSCPSCGDASKKLNATMTGEVMSFIFFTRYNKKIKIGCPHCLDKANKTALAKSAIFGWWGIPWGIIHTIGSITLNIRSRSQNHSPEHSKYLRGFVLSKVGELATYKNDQEKLQEIMVSYNHS